MKFNELDLGGAFVIELDRREDDRGFFARTFCRDEFREHGLNPDVVQSSIAFNRQKGTIRGMHFQFPPAHETKLIRVTRGSLFDVIIDLRPESPTFLQHAAVELSAENRRSLYVPARFAHGYQTLEDETEATYDIGAAYAPDLEGGLSPLDRCLELLWPLPVSAISAKDRALLQLESIRDEVTARMGTAHSVSRR